MGWAMKVSIHIKHTSQDDLDKLRSIAHELGFAIVSFGEFLGLGHTELRREMDMAALEELFIAREKVA